MNFVNKKLDIKYITNLINQISIHANSIEHSDKSVMEHLVGTYKILAELETSNEVKVAGALHNIYGTEKFPWKVIDTNSRKSIQDKVGKCCEELIFLFSKLKWDIFIQHPPSTSDSNFNQYFLCERDIDKHKFSEVVLIFFANLIEQVEVIPNNKRLFFSELLLRYRVFMSKEQSDIAFERLNPNTTKKDFV